MRKFVFPFAALALCSTAFGAARTGDSIANRIEIVAKQLTMPVLVAAPANIAATLCFRMGRITMQIKEIEDSPGFMALPNVPPTHVNGNQAAGNQAAGNLAAAKKYMQDACDIEESDPVALAAGVVDAQINAVAALKSAVQAAKGH